MPDQKTSDVLSNSPFAELSSARDTRISMEHPFFALRPGDKNVRRYSHGDIEIEVTPSIKGLATVYDQDILIYCVSLLAEPKIKNMNPSRTVKITTHDFLITTRRGTGGKDYARLDAALDRIDGTRIKTNIQTGGKSEDDWFGLVDKIHKTYNPNSRNRRGTLEITLSEWFFNAITEKGILAVHLDYFKIRKPLERRLYSLGRKHCGNQPCFRVGIEILHKKVGSTDSLSGFKRQVRSIVNSPMLPEYRIAFNSVKNQVGFYNKNHIKGTSEISKDICKYGYEAVSYRSL